MKHLKELLVAKGKTQTELAGVLNRDKSAITNLLQGKRQLKADEVVKIAAFLQVSEAEVLGIQPSAVSTTPRRPHPSPQAFGENAKIPFYGAPSAAIQTSKQIVQEKDSYYFEANHEVNNKTYALEVQDNSMNLQGFMPGDVVISEMELPCKAGDVVIVQKYDNDAAETLLRYYKPPFLEAYSTDGSFERLHEERGNVRLISPVIRLIRLLK